MLCLTEIALVLYLGFLIWRLLRGRFVRQALGLGVLLAALVGSSLVFLVTGAGLRAILSNVVLVLAGSTCLGVGGYLAIVCWLTRRVRRNDEALARRIEDRIRLPQWLDRTLRGLLAMMLLGLAFALVDLVVGLASFTPIRDRIAEQTILMRLLLRPQSQHDWDAPPSLPPVAAAPSLDEVIEEQSRFFRGLGKVASDGRNFLAEKTGTKAVLERIAAVREIVDLPNREKQWLIETTPDLHRLLSHPTMVAIMDDRRLLGLIEEVPRGSLAAIYKLGDDPTIKALLDDDRIVQVVTAIDLMAIKRKLRERRERVKQVRPTEWLTVAMRSTTDLDATLAKREGWTKQSTQEGALMWGPDVRIGLARTAIVCAQPTRVPVECRGEGRPTLWVNGEGVPLGRTGVVSRAVARLTAGRSELVLMIDFRGTDPPRTCSVELAE